MKPVIAICWHAEMSRAVELEHNGDHDVSVMYIAATLSTKEKKRYLKGRLEDFLNGIPPEVFRGELCDKDCT